MARTLEEAKKDFKIGRIYELKDYDTPFVWTGEFFEDIVTDYKAPHDARFGGDYYDRPIHIANYPNFINALDIYRPERFEKLL